MTSRVPEETVKSLLRTACALVLAGTAAQAAPSSSRPVFKADVQAVNLTVTVRDRDRYVSGLEAQDFQVLEDGAPQEMSVFSREETPISLAILLDTSGSMEGQLPQAQAAALRLVHGLRPADEAQIVHFNERVRVVRDFTSDQEALESAIRSVHASGGTALYSAVYISLKDLARRRRDMELRRRAVVVLSDGEDTASLVTDDQVLDLARSTDIAVHGVGMLPAADAARAATSNPGLSRFFMSALSRETGGGAYFPSLSSQLGDVYSRILQELRSQYTIGYVSTNPRRDGRWRRIVVRVLAQSGLDVRYKPGYRADAQSAPAGRPDPATR